MARPMARSIYKQQVCDSWNARLREEAYEAGEGLSPSDKVRAVIAEASGDLYRRAVRQALRAGLGRKFRDARDQFLARLQEVEG